MRFISIIKMFLTLAILSLTLTACGDSTATDIENPICRKVEMYGDSITYQARQTIEEFLPCYTVVNRGVAGAMARAMPIPQWDSETVYTISYGANECLNKVPVESYRLTLNHILNEAKGHKVVLEAPWRLTNPRCAGRIDQYRNVVVELGAQYGVPVAIENDQTHDGGGIHLPTSHTRARAELLAFYIKGLL